MECHTAVLSALHHENCRKRNDFRSLPPRAKKSNRYVPAEVRLYSCHVRWWCEWLWRSQSSSHWHFPLSSAYRNSILFEFVILKRFFFRKLKQAEASVAAPFTSKEQNITCVKHLALEGRCALVTSFGLFKYMTMYSLIQFITILIMYSVSLPSKQKMLYGF